MRYAIALEQRLLDAGVKPTGLGARDTLRLEAGMPLYGHELGPDIAPAQAGLGRGRHVGEGGRALRRRHGQERSPSQRRRPRRWAADRARRSKPRLSRARRWLGLGTRVLWVR